jgi:hypothetical protein
MSNIEASFTSAWLTFSLLKDAGILPDESRYE